MLRPKATEHVHQKNTLQDPDPEKNFPQTSWHKAFTKLVANHGYWTIHLDEESSPLKGFNTPFGR